MCTTNIYTYDYPDGRKETSSQPPQFCSHARHGKPCFNNVIIRHPVQYVTSGSGTPQPYPPPPDSFLGPDTHELNRERLRARSFKLERWGPYGLSEAVLANDGSRDAADDDGDDNGNEGDKKNVEVSRSQEQEQQEYEVVQRAKDPKDQEVATTHHANPLGYGEDHDGEGDSDSSAAPSLFSVQSYASSVDSVETRRHMTEQLADLLFDRGTREQYEHAVAKLDPEKFARQHNKLLKHYLDDLRSTADDAITLSALRALRSKSQRQRVTELIAEMASGRVAKSDPRVRQQREKGISDRIRRTQAKSKGKERALEHEDSSESDDDDGGGTIDMFDYLGHIIDFFLKGQPFANLETRLEYMVNVPESITEVLNMGDVHKLTVYLESYFRDAAIGEYEWIEDLKEVCPRSEIAQLLYERKYDSPWIYFEPSPQYPGTPERGVTHGHHIADCAHRLPHPSPPGAKGPANLSQDELKEVKQALEELCGVAGIAPRSRDLSDWPGTAAFRENDDNSVEIRYHSAGRERTDILASVFDILDRIRVAIGMLQSLKLMCSSFTVLAIPPPDEGKDVATMVHLVPISIDLIWSLRTCVHPINRDASYALNFTPKQAIRKVFGWHRAVRSKVDAMDDVYALALAVQMLTVGFLSYSQAHIGPLQPFFLDRPLHRIDLLGIERDDEQGKLSYVTVSLVEPSCIGGMTRGPVMAFHFSDTEVGGSSRKYDVCSKPVDILDTWGPGELVLRAGNAKVPMAIRVGGGFISPPSDEDGVVSIPSGYTTPASSDDEESGPPPKKDRSALKYHWDRVAQISNTSPPLDLKKNIIVAGSVRVNEGCHIDETKCWEASYTYFEELGTYRSYSEVTEYQVGLQGGPGNFAFTMNKVWGKCPGKTIKARYLERGSDDLISFLQFYFGVRVSFCTGVAQRVRLSQLVADLLPSFSSALTNGRERGWLAELESEENDIVDRFRGAHDALLAWIASLSGDLYRFVTTLVRWILTTLADTGLNPGNGTEFVVAWPHRNGIVTKGFRIPLNEGNKWAAMLADSDDCATFAYVTSTCLVATGGQSSSSSSSSSSLCRGPMPIWIDTITLLETAVFCPASKTPSSWSLTAEQAYFFQKLDNNLFWVKARVIPPQGTSSSSSSNSTLGGAGAGKDGSVLVRLVSSKSIPQDFRQRFLVREGRKKERRLREKDLESVWSRAVVVLPGR